MSIGLLTLTNSVSSRRVIVAALGILCLFVLGMYVRSAEAVAMPIAMISMGVAGANAFDRSKAAAVGVKKK